MEESTPINLYEYLTEETKYLSIKEICLEQVHPGYYIIKQNAFVELQKRGFPYAVIYDALVNRYKCNEHFVTNEIIEKYKKHLEFVDTMNQGVILYLESQIENINFSMIGTATFSLLVSYGLAASNIENNDINDWPNAVYTYITLFNFYKAQKSIDLIEKAKKRLQELKKANLFPPKT